MIKLLLNLIIFFCIFLFVFFCFFGVKITIHDKDEKDEE